VSGNVARRSPPWRRRSSSSRRPPGGGPAPAARAPARRGGTDHGETRDRTGTGRANPRDEESAVAGGREQALTHPDPSRLRATPSISGAGGGMEAGDDRGRRGDRREMRRAGWLGRGEGMMRWRYICMYPGREPTPTPTPTQPKGVESRRRRRRGGWVGVCSGRTRRSRCARLEKKLFSQ